MKRATDIGGSFHSPTALCGSRRRRRRRRRRRCHRPRRKRADKAPTPGRPPRVVDSQLQKPMPLSSKGSSKGGASQNSGASARATLPPLQLSRSHVPASMGSSQSTSTPRQPQSHTPSAQRSRGQFQPPSPQASRAPGIGRSQRWVSQESMAVAPPQSGSGRPHPQSQPLLVPKALPRQIQPSRSRHRPMSSSAGRLRLSQTQASQASGPAPAGQARLGAPHPHTHCSLRKVLSVQKKPAGSTTQAAGLLGSTEASPQPSSRQLRSVQPASTTPQPHVQRPSL